MVFEVVFKDCHNGVYIRYRSSGNLFSIKRISADTKVSMNINRDLFYADDCDLVANTEADMQQLLNDCELQCTALGLMIDLRNTVVMYQPAPNVPYQEPLIYMYGYKLKAVKKLVYLGSTFNFC